MTKDLREARRLFALALETPGGLKIQTIHSFCQYVLARFPLEAGVAAVVSRARRCHRARTCARGPRPCARSCRRGDARLAAAVATFVTRTSEYQLHNVLNGAFGADRRKLERFLARAWRRKISQAQSARRTAQAMRPQMTSSPNSCAAMKRDERRLDEIVAWLAEGSANDAKHRRS